MNKFCAICVAIFVLVLPFTVNAQQEPGKERSPFEPTPEKEKKYGLVSITGNIGPVLVFQDDWSSDSPSFKIGIFYNFSDFFSVSFGGGIAKYYGPEEFILDKEGYGKPTIAFAEDIYFGPNEFEESWYSFQLTFRVPIKIVSPYIFAGVKYASIDYKQEMFFRYSEDEEYYSTIYEIIIDKLGLYGGGGLAFGVASYLDFLLECEYNVILNTDVFEDRMNISIGFRFTI